MILIIGLVNLKGGVTMFDFLIGLGVIGLILSIVIILILPFIFTVVVGVALANLLGFTGFTWWAFVILFYLVIGSILGAYSKKI